MHGQNTLTLFASTMTTVNVMQDAFFGYFANNKPHGEVLVHYCDGSKHEGSFRQGVRHGRGTTQEENGNRVIGTWAEDKRDGIFEVGSGVHNTQTHSSVG